MSENNNNNNNNNNNEIADQNPVPEKMKKTQFPEGLRVLAVDDDMTCLKTLAVMLQKCQYQVTETTKATEALDLLRKNKDNYDIVITDVRMPDMDGFELLRIIGLEMDVPVIMMSANDDTTDVMKGVRHGARDYLVKPVRMLELKNIWQHVMRKTILNPNKSSVMTKEDMEKLPLKKRRDKSMEMEEQENTLPDGDSVAAKKPRFAWTKELHKKFVDAVQQLDAERAVPKKILEVMNEPQLTREIIASHLQKYRNFLKKQQDSMNEDRTSNAGLNWAHGGVLNTTSTTSSDNKVLSVLGRANSSGEYSSSVDGILSFRDQFLSKPDTLNTSLNEGFMIVPLNQQNLLLQQNIHSSRMADQVRPPKPVPLLENMPSGLAWATNPSRMIVDDYINMSSQIPNFGAGQSGAPISYTNFGTVQSGHPGFPGFVVRQPCPNKVPMPGLVSYPCPPGAFNFVRTPNHMLGDASTQFSPISQPTSLPGRHEGRGLTVFNGRTGSDFRGQSTGHRATDKTTVNGQGTYTQLLTDTIEIEDDDFNSVLKQFGRTSAPALYDGFAYHTKLTADQMELKRMDR